MTAVAEGLAFGAHYSLPQDELLNGLLPVVVSGNGVLQ
ncbi:hypothetical protein ACVWWH_003513 [Sinomonas sp. RB5]